MCCRWTTWSCTPSLSRMGNTGWRILFFSVGWRYNPQFSAAVLQNFTFWMLNRKELRSFAFDSWCVLIIHRIPNLTQNPFHFFTFFFFFCSPSPSLDGKKDFSGGIFLHFWRREKRGNKSNDKGNQNQFLKPKMKIYLREKGVGGGFMHVYNRNEYMRETNLKIK